MSRAIRRARGALACAPGRPARTAAAARALGRPVLAVLALAVAALSATGGRAGAAELQIEAPRFTFDQATHTYTYEDGKLTLGELSLYADHMELNTDTGRVQARGQVRVESKDVSGTAAAMELDANTRVGTLHQADLYVIQSGLYLRAEEVLVHPDGRLRVRRCTLTSCPPGVPGAWSIVASTVELEPEGLGVAWNPRLFIGPVPVLWLPGIAWPTVNERRTGLLAPELTHQSSSLERFNLGWRLRLPVFVNLGYDHDLTATPDWVQNRGLALGLEYNYAFWERQRGRLTLWGLRERDPRAPAEENDVLTPLALTPPTAPLMRYRADWEHNQALGAAGRLVTTYRDSSDGQVRREYDALTEFRPYRTYQASLSGQWDWAALALTVEQNSDFQEESVYARDAAFTDLRTRPQLQPRLTTHLGGRLLAALPLTLELGLSATRFQAEEDVSGLVTTASPSLSLPLSLGGAFELRPSVTRRFVRYAALEDYNGGSPLEPADESFAQTEAQLELRTALARIYTPQGGRFEALKHRIVPRLVFTEVQDVPQTDYSDGVNDRVLRARVAQRLVTLRVDNTVLGRPRSEPPAPGASAAAAGGAAEGPAAAFAASDGPVQQLFRLDAIQRYNLLLREDAPALAGPQPTLRQETLPGEPLLPLRLELEAQSGQFSATAHLNYHHQLRRNTESALSLWGSTPAGTSLGIAYGSNEYSYVTPDNKTVAAGDSLTFSGVTRWADAWALGFGGRINLSDSEPPLSRRVDQAEAYVEYHPVCYTVRFSYIEQVVPTIEGGTTSYYLDRQYAISFDLAGLVGGALRPPAPAPAVSSLAPTVPHGPTSAHCRS